MDTPRFPHRVEYTKNKHSRAVVRGETIVIRLARGLSHTEQEHHIRNLLRRMTHILLREREKIAIDPFRELLNGETRGDVRLASGRAYAIALRPGPRTRTRRTADGWDIALSPRVRRAALHRGLWNLIAAEEEPRIQELVTRINALTFGARLADVRVRFMRSQWGSCSARGVITLNAALLFLPPSALQYVIVHELAHRRIQNHSPAFWRLVASALPGYEEPYRLLQRYRLPQD